MLFGPTAFYGTERTYYFVEIDTYYFLTFVIRVLSVECEEYIFCKSYCRECIYTSRIWNSAIHDKKTLRQPGLATLAKTRPFSLQPVQRPLLRLFS